MVRRAFELLTFLRQSIRDFYHTGAVLPSSKSLAAEMVSEIPAGCGPVNILEVGAGTGVFSRAIIERVGRGEIDLCEINPRFASLLRKRLEKDPSFKKPGVTVRVYELDARLLETGRKYDHIVSGLPMNGFDAVAVREFFDLFARLLKPGGTLSYFEYIGVRAVKMPFSGKSERRRLRRVGAVVRRMQRRYQYKCRKVLSNFPPAYARHLRFDGGPEASPARGSTERDPA